jgi:hypothetical protein
MNELQIRRDALADVVIGAVMEAFQKLADHREDIAQLWSEFAHLQPGETIKGCRTKGEFCDQHLHRNIRSVQYMLRGGNHNRRETVSRPTTIQVIEGETVSRPTLEDIEANEIYQDENAVMVKVRLGDVQPNPFLKAIKGGDLPPASAPPKQGKAITLKEWRGLGRPTSVPYRLPSLKVPLVLPPSTGDLSEDNHIRHAFARALDYPYPFHIEGVPIIPVVFDQIRLAQVVNEQSRLKSLGKFREASCLEGLIVELMCEHGKEIERKKQKQQEDEAMDLYTWIRQRLDMEDVDRRKGRRMMND